MEGCIFHFACAMGLDICFSTVVHLPLPREGTGIKRGCFTFMARLKVQLELGTNPNYCAFQSQPFCVGYLYPEANISQ